MNEDYTEQPFNLETALKHPEWVRTRDGREIDFIKEYPKKANGTNVVFITKDGWTYSADTDGTWHQNLKTNNDLILRVPYQTVFVVLQANGDAKWYKNEGTANNIVKSGNGIACVPVKINAPI